MIISDLTYIEAVSEAPAIVGGFKIVKGGKSTDSVITLVAIKQTAISQAISKGTGATAMASSYNLAQISQYLFQR